MPEDTIFQYDWHLALSKYNTIRYEDRNRQAWQESGMGKFIRNDRFHCQQKPTMVEITIRKTYKIPLA